MSDDDQTPDVPRYPETDAEPQAPAETEVPLEPHQPVDEDFLPPAGVVFADET